MCLIIVLWMWPLGWWITLLPYIPSRILTTFLAAWISIRYQNKTINWITHRLKKKKTKHSHLELPCKTDNKPITKLPTFKRIVHSRNSKTCQMWNMERSNSVSYLFHMKMMKTTLTRDIILPTAHLYMYM